MEITLQARSGEIAADLLLATRVFTNLNRRIHFKSDVLFSRLAVA